MKLNEIRDELIKNGYYDWLLSKLPDDSPIKYVRSLKNHGNVRVTNKKVNSLNLYLSKEHSKDGKEYQMEAQFDIENSKKWTLTRSIHISRAKTNLNNKEVLDIVKFIFSKDKG